MSKTRQLIEHLAAAKAFSYEDLDRVLSEWDIPLDERITPYEASIWLYAQLEAQEQILMTLVSDCMSDDEWDDAVRFVLKCLRKGIVPHEYVNLLIARQQDCNYYYS